MFSATIVTDRQARRLKLTPGVWIHPADESNRVIQEVGILLAQWLG